MRLLHNFFILVLLLSFVCFLSSCKEDKKEKKEEKKQETVEQTSSKSPSGDRGQPPEVGQQQQPPAAPQQAVQVAQQPQPPAAAPADVPQQAEPVEQQPVVVQQQPAPVEQRPESVQLQAAVQVQESEQESETESELTVAQELPATQVMPAVAVAQRAPQITTPSPTPDSQREILQLRPATGGMRIRREPLPQTERIPDGQCPSLVRDIVADDFNNLFNVNGGNWLSRSILSLANSLVNLYRDRNILGCRDASFPEYGWPTDNDPTVRIQNYQRKMDQFLTKEVTGVSRKRILRACTAETLEGDLNSTEGQSVLNGYYIYTKKRLRDYILSLMQELANLDSLYHRGQCSNGRFVTPESVQALKDINCDEYEYETELFEFCNELKRCTTPGDTAFLLEKGMAAERVIFFLQKIVHEGTQRAREKFNEIKESLKNIPHIPNNKLQALVMNLLNDEEDYDTSIVTTTQRNFLQAYFRLELIAIKRFFENSGEDAELGETHEYVTIMQKMAKLRDYSQFRRDIKERIDSDMDNIFRFLIDEPRYDFTTELKNELSLDKIQETKYQIRMIKSSVPFIGEQVWQQALNSEEILSQRRTHFSHKLAWLEKNALYREQRENGQNPDWWDEVRIAHNRYLSSSSRLTNMVDQAACPAMLTAIEQRARLVSQKLASINWTYKCIDLSRTELSTEGRGEWCSLQRLKDHLKEASAMPRLNVPGNFAPEDTSVNARVARTRTAFAEYFVRTIPNCLDTRRKASEDWNNTISGMMKDIAITIATAGIGSAAGAALSNGMKSLYYVLKLTQLTTIGLKIGTSLSQDVQRCAEAQRTKIELDATQLATNAPIVPQCAGASRLQQTPDVQMSSERAFNVCIAEALLEAMKAASVVYLDKVWDAQGMVKLATMEIEFFHNVMIGRYRRR